MRSMESKVTSCNFTWPLQIIFSILISLWFGYNVLGLWPMYMNSNLCTDDQCLFRIPFLSFLSVGLWIFNSNCIHTRCVRIFFFLSFFRKELVGDYNDFEWTGNKQKKNYYRTHFEKRNMATQIHLNRRRKRQNETCDIKNISCDWMVYLMPFGGPTDK